MYRQTAVIFAVLLATSIDGGRLVQEDPWNHKAYPNKPLVQEAPDDFVARRHPPRPRLQKITTPSPTTTTTTTSTIRPPAFIANVPVNMSSPPPLKFKSPTAAPKAKQEQALLTSPSPLTPTLRIKRRGKKYKIANHRLMNATKLPPGNQAKNDKSDLTRPEPNSLFDLPKELETDYEETGGTDNPKNKRQIPVFTTYPPHVLPLDKYFFLEAEPTLKYPYEKCFVSLGYENNEECLPGEVCVDGKRLEEYPCINGPVPCPACTPGVPDTCPRGCKPDTDCPPKPTGYDRQGVCADPKRDEAEYDTSDLSSTRRTPIVYFPGALGLGAACSVYGDLIDEAQKSDLEFGEKSKKLRGTNDLGNLAAGICNWAQARLECIPNKPRMPTTTVAGTLLTDLDIEASKKLGGTCQCMLALGESAAVVEQEITLNKICYIPANKGRSSKCDHEIYPPHGAIEGIRNSGQPIVRIAEPAAKFCTPNSECRPGYKYTGLRCQCDMESQRGHVLKGCGGIIPGKRNEE